MPNTSISTVLVRPLVRALEDVPGALDAFWSATDLTPQMVLDTEARVSPAQFCVAWAEAQRLSGDPALALRIAEATPSGAFGIVEYVCRSTPTLKDALTQWVRYLGILDDAVEVGLLAEGGHGALRVLRESEAPAPASHELCFALIVRNARGMLEGRFRTQEVRFAHRVRPELVARYRAFFECDVSFGAAHTELVVPNEVLETRLPTADADLLAALLPVADRKRDLRTVDPPLTDQVRRALGGALRTGDAQLETVAKDLGLTARSLQRRLRDEGASFQTIRDRAREELADDYLRRGLSVAEISFLLGFSEPSAFFRAFKRWTGVTPIERRDGARGPA